jgi:hypothetical protein
MNHGKKKRRGDELIENIPNNVIGENVPYRYRKLLGNTKGKSKELLQCLL